MTRKRNIVQHQCVMPECGHTMPLAVVTNVCERNCPKCDDGMGLKTMLAEIIGREIKVRSELFHVRESMAHHLPEIHSLLTWVKASSDLRELLISSRVEKQTCYFCECPPYTSDRCTHD